MKKIVTITIILLSQLACYYLGYAVGRTPNNTDLKNLQESNTHTKDLETELADYKQLYNLCENKYQTAIRGDLNTATRINGEMDVLKSQADGLENKYQLTPL